MYDFKDSRTSGVVVVTKTWEDSLSNAERPVPDISISTVEPSKLNRTYTITFHGNGMKFADGSEENTVIYNGSGQVISGTYKEPPSGFSAWYFDTSFEKKVSINKNGTLSPDFLNSTNNVVIDVYAKTKTLVLSSNLNSLIPDNTEKVVFTDKPMPDSAILIDVDADGDGGVVAWMEKDNPTLIISSQIAGKKVIAKYCNRMFYKKKKITEIDFSNLDTSNVTNMQYMFCLCKEIKTLDLSSFNTSSVTSMHSMFSGCESLKILNITSFDTSKVKDMAYMFNNCSSLTDIDLSSFNTINATDMLQMFGFCSSLINLDLSNFNSAKVTDMTFMFDGCSKLTSLDLTSLDTSKVTKMYATFKECSKLTNLSLGDKFAFVGSDYALPSGTWCASDGTAYTSDGSTCTIPNNKADTYTRK